MVAFRPPFTLHQLFVSGFLIGMLALSFSVILFLQQRLSAYFYGDLIENGRTLSLRIAEESRLPIIQAAVEHIESRLETLAAYPNVTGLMIFDSRGKTLSAFGSNPVPPRMNTLVGASTTRTHVIERPDSVTIMTPVHERKITSPNRDPHAFGGRVRQPTTPSTSRDAPNIIGFVVLTLTKTPLQADLNQINRHILIVMWTGILSFTAVMLFALSQLTRPIQRLARVMSDPETVARFRRVEVRGVREAQLFAITFNALMARIADSQADLARQVEEAVREMKRQNAELVVARKQAEAASHAKSQFIANVSHEIRTPLHGLLGALSLLEKTPLSDKQNSYLVMIREDADRLLREMNSILDFSQLEARGLPLREQPCPLKKLLERVVKPFEVRAWAKKLRLTLSLDPDLPEWVRTDGEQFEKVIHNLIDNAIKFTAQGQVRIRAWHQQTDEDTCDLHLSVEDTGFGISPELQVKIFEPFTQVDSSTTRRHGGNGLGLAICRQLVELMNGRIMLKSQPGKGSTFDVELPFTLSPPAPECDNEPYAIQDNAHSRLIAPQDEAVSERRLGKSFRPGGRRVLVVDDERQSRLYAQFVLLELNAEVITAANGTEALTACARQRFDLILMDVRMPDMDGLETTCRVRHQRAGLNTRTPIIGLTADVLNLDQQDWKAAGMNACHHKPLESDVLAEIFTQWGIERSIQKFSLSAFLGTYYEH